MDGRVVLDCRWLGIGGAGRVTELAMRGLAQAAPGGRWVLWGRDAATRPLAWPGADFSRTTEDPRLMLGQRNSFRAPNADFFVFMHQQRPLRAYPAATFVYDTIPLRYGPSGAPRRLKRLFLRRIARISRPILTISEYSKACIIRDLDVPAERVEILQLPFDTAFVDRVMRRRRSERRGDIALFIGSFLPHKNVPRLLTAFSQTRFRRTGGRLVLVGGTGQQTRRLVEGLDPTERPFVTVRHSCSQAEIEDLYATSLFLVQPSLEEGFGLPAWEAMCCGLPICVSDGGALPEVTAGFAEPFPARSVPAMAEAMDLCAARARESDDQRLMRQSTLLRERAPSVEQFGGRLHAVVAEHSAARASSFRGSRARGAG